MKMLSRNIIGYIKDVLFTTDFWSRKEIGPISYVIKGMFGDLLVEKVSKGWLVADASVSDW